MKGSLFASTVLMVLTIGCNSGTSDKTAPATAAAAPNAPATVSTVAVSSRRLETTIALPAQLTPYEQVDIYPKVTGFVETVTVDRGSQFTEDSCWLSSQRPSWRVNGRKRKRRSEPLNPNLPRHRRSWLQTTGRIST